MPSISVIYTPNLTGSFDSQLLADRLTESARESKVFPNWGVRAFVIAAEASSIAEGDPNFGYVQVSVRIAPGRPVELQTKITEQFLAILKSELGLISNMNVGYAIDLTELTMHSYRSGGNLPGSPTAEL